MVVARTGAAVWLRNTLTGGPMLADDMRKAGEDAGYSLGTLRRAKDELGIVPRKAGFGAGWTWRLQTADPDEHDLCEGAHEGAKTERQTKVR